jgi:hypothetical protein
MGLADSNPSFRRLGEPPVGQGCRVAGGSPSLEEQR